MKRIVENVAILFLLLLTLPTLAVPGGASSPLDSEEQQEVEKFAYEMSDAGILMTPPRGQTSPAVRETRALLERVIHTLSPELKADGVSLVVNIYASPVNNAWIQQLDPNYEESQEFQWAKHNKSKIWPLRAAWGFRNDGKPIYEIGVTSKLLETLETEDEIAVALRHEIQHLKEGHTNAPEGKTERTKKWWSSQSNEVVADDGAVKGIVGHYELEAALTLMTKLHPEKEEALDVQKAVYGAMKEGADAHHSEGLRISLLQARIQELRSSDERAKPRPFTPLPDIIRQDFKKEALQRLAQKESDWARKIEYALNDVERSRDSKANKMDTLFDTLLLTGAPAVKSPFRLMSPELKFRLKRFLLQNSVGPDAWTAADYRNYRFRYPSSMRLASRTQFMRLFIADEEGRKMLADLAKLSPAWDPMISYWSSIDSFQQNHFGRIVDPVQSISFNELTLYRNILGHDNLLTLPEPDVERLRSELIHNIASQGSSTFYKPDENGRVQFDNFAANSIENSSYAETDPVWLEKWRTAFAPHIRVRVPAALEKLREIGVAKCEKCVSYSRYFNEHELNEVLNILEAELQTEEVSFSYAMSADTEFLIVQLFKKYQHDPEKTFQLLKHFYHLEEDQSQLKETMAEALVSLPKKQIVDFMLSGETVSRDSFTRLLLATPKGKQILASLNVDELKELIQRLDVSRLTLMGASTESIFELFASHISHFQDPKELIQNYVALTRAAGIGFVLTPALQNVFRGPLKKALDGLSIDERHEQLKQKQLWQILGAEYVGRNTALYANQLKLSDLPKKIEQTMSEIPLKEKWPEAFRVFRNSLSEIARVQPSEVSSIFPDDDRTNTEKIKEYNALIRGLSAFSSFVKDLSKDQQLETIEFVMGRQSQMPTSLKQATRIINKKMGASALDLDVESVFLLLREKLQYQSTLERAFAINTVLAGKNSILSSQEGFQSILDRILEPVSAKNRPMARIVLDALLKAEGRNRTLILSYVLAQKPVDKDGQLTEAMVLRSLLDFYGVPGVKLAQYLAFTSEFKDFQSALESYQNAAMPISYYDALLLIQKHLGAKWDPTQYRVIKIRGSGSVNIAIEYENLKTGHHEILTISRDEIEAKTKDDFRRFNLLIEALMGTEHKEKFEYLTGLMRLIQKSVSLEFDKPHAYKMQKGVHSLYDQTMDGWKIQSVDAFEVMNNKAIRMELAPGFGALEMSKENPKMYESAMRALMRVEYSILRGTIGGNSSPIPLYANPDFHDGQVLIDPVTKTVTILDFGQVVEVSNAEREFALDMLSIISGVESTSSAIRLLQKHMKVFSSKDIPLDEKEMRRILASKDKMEIFVYLLSYMERQGFESPLAVVHWLLGANRLAKLGQKVNVSVESSFGWLLGMRKITSTINAGKSFIEKLWGGGKEKASVSAVLHLKCSAAHPKPR